MNKIGETIKNYALSVIVPVVMIILLLIVSPETPVGKCSDLFAQAGVCARCPGLGGTL